MFWGYEEIVDITKLDYICVYVSVCVCVCGGGIISIHLKAFLKVKFQNGNMLLGTLRFF